MIASFESVGAGGDSPLSDIVGAALDPGGGGGGGGAPIGVAVITLMD